VCIYSIIVYMVYNCVYYRDTCGHMAYERDDGEDRLPLRGIMRGVCVSYVSCIGVVSVYIQYNCVYGV
jgi:hypothetical protein